MYGTSFDGCKSAAIFLCAFAAIGFVTLVLGVAWLIAHIDVSWVG